MGCRKSVSSTSVIWRLLVSEGIYGKAWTGNGGECVGTYLERGRRQPNGAEHRCVVPLIAACQEGALRRKTSETENAFCLSSSPTSLTPAKTGSIMANVLTLESLFVPSPSTVRGQSIKLSSRGNVISYAANRSAIIRTLSLDSKPSPVDSLAFPTLSAATVAKISPSGQYLAIGETNGTVKVWDLSNKEDRKVKFEFKNGGRVIDLAWDGESARIAFVGEGKEKFGSFYSLSTGTQVGQSFLRDCRSHFRLQNSE